MILSVKSNLPGSPVASLQLEGESLNTTPNEIIKVFLRDIGQTLDLILDDLASGRPVEYDAFGTTIRISRSESRQTSFCISYQHPVMTNSITFFGPSELDAVAQLTLWYMSLCKAHIGTPTVRV
jgi:hypothetical protein